jgi:putative NADH-flavin reductase
MKLMILGGSGRTGKPLIEQALAAGNSVQTLVRNPAKLSISHPQLKIIKGDSTDSRALKAALQDTQAVLSVMGPVKGSPIDLLLATYSSLITVMEESGIRRLIVLTGAGVQAQEDRPKLIDRIFRLLLQTTAGAVLHDSEQGIARIRESNLDWTIVRAPRLTDGALTGRYRIGYVGPDSGTQISRADVAEFMLRQLTDAQWLHKMPMISA